MLVLLGCAQSTAEAAKRFGDKDVLDEVEEARSEPAVFPTLDREIGLEPINRLIICP